MYSESVPDHAQRLFFGEAISFFMSCLQEGDAADWRSSSETYVCAIYLGQLGQSVRCVDKDRWDAPVRSRALPLRTSSMLAAPLARCGADDAAERACECSLVTETRMAGNVGQRHVGEHEQLLGAFDSSRGQPLMARYAEARLEGAREVAHRELALASEIRKPNRAVEVFAQELGDPPTLPRSEATCGWAALLS